MEDTSSELIAGGTGHRPKGIPTASLPWLSEMTRDRAAWLRRHGFTVGISGMADGFDLIWADAILTAGMRLWAAVPFPEQPERFPNPADRAEWRRLIDQAERVKVFGTLEGLTGDARGRRANQLLWVRNAGIITPADFLIYCWDPRRRAHCGTFNALNLARTSSRLRGALHLDPISLTTRRGLPSRHPSPAAAVPA